MVSKRKRQENQQIDEESKELIQSMQGGLNTFKELLADEDGLKTKAELIKENQRKERMKEEYDRKRKDVIIQQLRVGGIERMQYLASQLEYFNFFAYSIDSKQDNVLYKYRRKLRSEMQWIIMSNLHYPILLSSILYFITRQLKSGQMTAVLSSGALGLYTIHALHNTSVKYPFELAYPAHPLVVARRKMAIEKWCYYDPEIIKFELEYLNKYAYKDGYSRQFPKYTISVKNSELFIDCEDKFEDVFGFTTDVLEENQLMDVLNPKDIASHRDIVDNIFSVYSDFSEEYLREWYKPDTTHVKKALSKIKEEFEIDKSVFEEDADLLTKKEKNKKDLILKAYDELENEAKPKEKTNSDEK